MKASQLLMGRRAVQRVRLPLCNSRSTALPDLPELAEARERDRAAWQAEHPGEEPLGNEIEIGLRVLSGIELTDILEAAREFAKKRGVDKPEPTDPLYDLGMSVHTLALACVDPDHPDPDSPDALFFDGGVDQILASPHLGRDGITYLREMHETWQDLCAPQAKKLDIAEFDIALDEIASSGGLPFYYSLGPAVRWNLTHTMAVLLSTARTLKSTPIFAPEESGKTSSSKPKSKPSESKPTTTRRRSSKSAKA